MCLSRGIYSGHGTVNVELARVFGQQKNKSVSQIGRQNSEMSIIISNYTVATLWASICINKAFHFNITVFFLSGQAASGLNLAFHAGLSYPLYSYLVLYRKHIESLVAVLWEAFSFILSVSSISFTWTLFYLNKRTSRYCVFCSVLIIVKQLSSE